MIFFFNADEIVLWDICRASCNLEDQSEDSVGIDLTRNQTLPHELLEKYYNLYD